jgi:hypothetical protein
VRRVTSSVTYLLEDELSESHWGRSLVLILVLVAIGAAAWYWRAPLRAYVTARLSQRPSSNQSEPVSSEGAPVSTSPSEVAPGMPSADANAPIEKPKTGAGDLSSSVAQNPAPSANSPASSPAANAPGNTEPAAAAPANSAPVAQPPATAAPTSPAQPQPSPNSPAATESAANQGPSSPGEGNAAQNEAPKAESAVAKESKPKIKEAPVAKTDADQLEARGEKYLYGNGVAVNCGRAQSDLQAAAAQGNAKADSVLGTMYATGHCVTRDMPLAYRWFAKALREDPGNTRLQSDLQVLWDQMTEPERQIAMRHE